MFFGRKAAGVEWLVAGLGNPGEQYAKTRHNMGFLTLDLLAEREHVKINRIRFKSVTALADFGGARCLLMKPQTYMNLSGEAVREAAQYYKIPSDHVLVIYDDVSLPVGRIRVRPSGSAGGHNGIKNIIAQLGTDVFPRVKIGTGEPTGPERDMIGWVIGEPSQAEKKLLLDAFGRAVGAAECIIEHGCDRAMNQFN
jgi:PTH1 family peptidyl-tRNA hydrolase